MSTTAPSKRQIHPNATPSRQGLVDWFKPFLSSTIGAKQLVAVTGLVLTLFVIVHMAGNLLVFGGPEAINAYAKALKDKGPILWGGRIVLLAALVIHMGLALWLNWKAKKARPVAYAYEQTVQASWASRHMVLTGILVFVFLVYHLAHFTFGVTQSAEINGQNVNFLALEDLTGNRHDVYSMVLYGFSNPTIAILYLIAQVFLFLHLIHGVGSMFQTLGLNSPRAARLIKGLTLAVALIVCLGNAAIVVGVWAGVWSETMATVHRAAPVAGPPGPPPGPPQKMKQ